LIVLKTLKTLKVFKTLNILAFASKLIIGLSLPTTSSSTGYCKGTYNSPLGKYTGSSRTSGGNRKVSSIEVATINPSSKFALS